MTKEYHIRMFDMLCYVMQPLPPSVDMWRCWGTSDCLEVTSILKMSGKLVFRVLAVLESGPEVLKSGLVVTLVRSHEASISQGWTKGSLFNSYYTEV